MSNEQAGGEGGVDGRDDGVIETGKRVDLERKDVTIGRGLRAGLLAS